MRFLCCSFLSFFLLACSSTYPNKNIVGQDFPSVTGESLNKQAVNIPEAFAGKPVLFLIGYKQNSQFDIDRWLIGLDMTQTNIDVYELPTIQGVFPRMISTMIDNGMRKGIPETLWNNVITIYGDGDKIQALTGNTNPNNARVVLLDENSNIRYFYDQGFSVNALNSLNALIK